jgi:hypothetical protein
MAKSGQPDAIMTEEDAIPSSFAWPEALLTWYLFVAASQLPSAYVVAAAGADRSLPSTYTSVLSRSRMRSVSSNNTRDGDAFDFVISVSI